MPYVVKRVLQSLPVLFGVTLITFFIFHIAGGDPAYQLAGKNATPEQIDSIRQALGLDQPLFYQYLDFLKQCFTWDFGESWLTKENIMDMLGQRLGPSLSLTIPAFLITIFIALIISLWSVYHQGRWIDHLVTSSCLVLMSISFLIYIIVFQYLIAFRWGLFPVSGWDPSWSERWTYLVLPWFISVIVSLGPYTLVFRSALAEQAQSDYLRTAKAKGVTPQRLYSRHLLSNSLIPILTIVLMQVPFLIMGSLLLEAFFRIPGLGDLLIQSIQNSDFPMIKALTVLGSMAYLFFNVLSDLIYSWVDPRVNLS